VYLLTGIAHPAVARGLYEKGTATNVMFLALNEMIPGWICILKLSENKTHLFIKSQY